MCVKISSIDKIKPYENILLVELVALKQIKQQKNNTNPKLGQAIAKLQMLFGKLPH